MVKSTCIHLPRERFVTTAHRIVSTSSSAAVCGNIFSSPNANQVRRGIELVENEKGTIIIVKFVLTATEL